MLRSPVGRFRAIALAEGLSYLVLLLVAMPLKYWLGIPEAVRVVGALHGALFVIFMLSLAQLATSGWAFKHVVGAFVASLVPFGTFVMDRSWKRLEGEARDAP